MDRAHALSIYLLCYIFYTCIFKRSMMMATVSNRIKDQDSLSKEIDLISEILGMGDVHKTIRDDESRSRHMLTEPAYHNRYHCEVVALFAIGYRLGVYVPDILKGRVSELLELNAPKYTDTFRSRLRTLYYAALMHDFGHRGSGYYSDDDCNIAISIENLRPRSDVEMNNVIQLIMATRYPYKEHLYSRVGHVYHLETDRKCIRMADLSMILTDNGVDYVVNGILSELSTNDKFFKDDLEKDPFGHVSLPKNLMLINQLRFLEGNQYLPGSEQGVDMNPVIQELYSKFSINT